jgi:hypothetical protein
MYQKAVKQGDLVAQVYTCPACESQQQSGPGLEQLRSEYREAAQRVDELERSLEAARERVASLGIKIQAAESIAKERRVRG